MLEFELGDWQVSLRPVVDADYTWSIMQLPLSPGPTNVHLNGLPADAFDGQGQVKFGDVGLPDISPVGAGGSSGI